ncbi:MAG: hypothetical protein AAF968_12715 [Pseudomonadota bacterium]
MIRRITPLPIEPPLQIWLCPMSGGVALPGTAATGADIDISDPAFDPVRSIEVYTIDWLTLRYEGSHGPVCRRYISRVEIGRTGPQGSFDWTTVPDPSALPAWMTEGLMTIGECDWVGRARAVGLSHVDAVTGDLVTEYAPY